MEREIIYLGRSNTIDLLLKIDGVVADLSSVTAVSLSIEGTKYESTDKASGIITWDQPTYDTGEIRVGLGGQTIPTGKFEAALILTDPTNPDGIDWGSVPVQVLEDREGT